MPNWDHKCPSCGESGSYLDFGTASGDSEGQGTLNARGRCPWCGHADDAEAFYDLSYYGET